MTLDEAVSAFQWSPAHDYGAADYEEGKIVGLRGLGVWATDLQKLRQMVPRLALIEIGRIKRMEGDWLHVDVWER